MRCAVWPLIFACLTASAQFQNLVTTSDGQQLYFSTPLRLRGTDQFDSPKIFRYLGNTGSFELVAEVQQQPPIGYRTNLFQLTQPDISADGAILVYTATGICYGGSSCIGYVSSAGQITGASLPADDSLQGESIRISRDGQYVLRLGAKTELIQLASGQVVTLNVQPSAPQPIGDGYETLADGGVALLYGLQGEGPLLFQGGTITPLPLSKNPMLARISRDASRIVYETYETGQAYQLIAYNVAQATETVLAQGPVAIPPPSPFSAPAPYFLPWLTDDGLQAIYLAAPAEGQPKQVYLVSTGTGTIRKLTDIPEGVSSAVISGSGNIVYAATTSNRLFEADTASGNLRQLTNRTPQILAWEGGAAPGSLISLAGVGLAGTDGTATVRIGGLDAPTVDFTADSGYVQIPWELAPDPTAVVPVSVGAESDSLFEQVFSITVAEAEPFFLTVSVPGGRQAVIAHQDFRGLVTAADPAVPGETLHFYMTGLGPVSPAISTGQVTPVNSRYVISTPPMCSFAGLTAMPVTLPFAGLAPGLLGIYQLDVQVPQGLTTPKPQFQCSAHNGDIGITYDVASVPVQSCTRLRRPAKSRGSRQCEYPGAMNE